MITCVWRRTVVNDVSLHQRFLFWHLLFGAVAARAANCFSLMLHKRKTSQIIRNRKRCSSHAAMHISRCSIVIYFLYYFYLFSLLFVYNW